MRHGKTFKELRRTVGLRNAYSASKIFRLTINLGRRNPQCANSVIETLYNKFVKGGTSNAKQNDNNG